MKRPGLHLCRSHRHSRGPRAALRDARRASGAFERPVSARQSVAAVEHGVCTCVCSLRTICLALILRDWRLRAFFSSTTFEPRKSFTWYCKTRARVDCMRHDWQSSTAPDWVTSIVHNPRTLAATSDPDTRPNGGHPPPPSSWGALVALSRGYHRALETQPLLKCAPGA
jgi:hypothetical protein